MRSAGQQLLGHPSSVARPLRPVNLGPRDGAVEQHHQSASRRFRVLHPRRRRPLAETLREPRSLTVSNDARRVRRIGELAHRMLQRAPAEVLGLRPRHHPVEGGRREMEVNVFGTLAVTQAFAPVLAKNGGGAIANLNSVASFVSFPILATYSASKAATHSLTQVTRAMLRGQNTQVFGVYPGPIDTRMGEALNAEKASPADAARAIVAGIIAGNEEIFPDKTSQGVGPAFFADPKGLERQVAGVPAAA